MSMIGEYVPADHARKLELALRELVSLKDLKQKIEAGRADDLNELAAMERDYDLRKPIAWSAARVALSPENVPSPATAGDGTKDHG